MMKANYVFSLKFLCTEIVMISNFEGNFLIIKARKTIYLSKCILGTWMQKAAVCVHNRCILKRHCIYLAYYVKLV